MSLERFPLVEYDGMNEAKEKQKGHGVQGANKMGRTK